MKFFPIAYLMSFNIINACYVLLGTFSVSFEVIIWFIYFIDMVNDIVGFWKLNQP